MSKSSKAELKCGLMKNFSKKIKNEGKGMIYHVAEKDEWAVCANSTEYYPERYEKDKFIHCSDEHQIEEIANSLFKGRKCVVLLKIDPTKLNAQTVYENSQGLSEKFPHVYGTISMQAIVKASELTCEENGNFTITEREL